MPIKVRCSCGKQLSVKDEAVGRRLKCPACAKVFVAEGLQPVAAQAPDPAVQAQTPADAPHPAVPVASPPPPSQEPTPLMVALSSAADLPPIPTAASLPRRRLLWPWIAGGAAVVGAAVIVLIVVLSGAGAAEDTHLRYTVSDANGFRSSLNRDSVMKTLGMSESELRDWANDSAAAEEKRMVGPVRQASGRAATYFKQGYNEIEWEGPSGKTYHSVRTIAVTLTSLDRDSLMKMLESRGPSGYFDHDQVRAWAADENAASEMRSAIIAQPGYVEYISRGILVKPPG